MRSRYLPGLLLTCFLGSTALLAQPPLKLKDAIDLGIKNNPALRIADDNVRIAGDKITGLHEQQLPFSKVSASYSEFSLITPFVIMAPASTRPIFELGKGSFGATMGSASIGEEIFGGFRIQNSLKAANYLLEAAKIDAEKNKQDFSFNITAAYFNIYRLMKSEELLGENMKVLDEKERELTSLEKGGMVTHNDILRIKLQKSNLQLSLEELKSALDIALNNLGVIIGASTPPTAIDTNSLFTNIPQSQTYEDFRKLAIDNRSELKTADLKMKAAMENIDIIRSNRYPHVGIGLGYNYIHPGNDFLPEKNQFINAWNAGVNLSYNISSLYADKGKLNEAHTAVDIANASRDLANNNILTETYKNFSNWQLAKKKIEVAGLSISQAEENYAMQESRYRNNITMLSDLLEANSLLLQARLNLVNAQTESQLDYYTLLQSTGTFK